MQQVGQLHMMRQVWWEPVFRVVIHKLEAWLAAEPCVALLVVPSRLWFPFHVFSASGNTHQHNGPHHASIRQRHIDVSHAKGIIA